MTPRKKKTGSVQPREVALPKSTSNKSTKQAPIVEIENTVDFYSYLDNLIDINKLDYRLTIPAKLIHEVLKIVSDIKAEGLYLIRVVFSNKEEYTIADPVLISDTSKEKESILKSISQIDKELTPIGTI
jgi:hypothetical protein